jgi:thioredoxin reductase
LVLGSGLKKPFADGKKVGIILHQRGSHLQNALFNNVLGLDSGSLGREILVSGKEQLATNYPEVIQIEKEKVLSINEEFGIYTVETTKNQYKTKIAVIALNYFKPLIIEGLEDYVEPHRKASAAKDRIQLKNDDHLIKQGLYVCGTIAGHRSQFAIAAGSGASVATDILSLWNDGKHTKVHDKV